MDWPYGGSFGPNDLPGEFGELREEEVEELRSERTIKSALKVSLFVCCLIVHFGKPQTVHYLHIYYSH